MEARALIPITVDEARDYWRRFLELRKAILSPDDYQVIKSPIWEKGKLTGWRERKFLKRSGFRKLATAFNLSVRIKSSQRLDLEEWIPAEEVRDQQVILESREAQVKVKGEIKSTTLYKVPKTVWRVEVVCEAPNGRVVENVGLCSSDERGFAHSEHDPEATATTRAINRAISDLIAGGELSAEEILPPAEAEGKLF